MLSSNAVHVAEAMCGDENIGQWKDELSCWLCLLVVACDYESQNKSYKVSA